MDDVIDDVIDDSDVDTLDEGDIVEARGIGSDISASGIDVNGYGGLGPA